jgi:hypothetical protein
MSKLRDVVKKAQGESMAESPKNEKQVLPHEYGCEVLLEKTSLDKVKDPSFPNDAYLIWYNVDNKKFLDLVRCPKMVNLFDMYYDKYGLGAVQKIDFGYGRVNPRLWGYKQPEKKKRK